MLLVIVKVHKAASIAALLVLSGLIPFQLQVANEVA